MKPFPRGICEAAPSASFTEDPPLGRVGATPGPFFGSVTCQEPNPTYQQGANPRELRRVLAAADFLAAYRAANPGGHLYRVPSDLLNEIEMDTLAASFR